MFAMLNGKLPFRGEDADVLRLAQLEKVKFNKHVCKGTRRSRSHGSSVASVNV